MIVDALNTFCDNVALNTGAAGSYILGDVIDLGTFARGLGSDPEAYLVITVDTAATSAGAATGQFSLVTDDNAAMASPVVLFSSATFPLASLVAGARVLVVDLPGTGLAERYLAIQQTTGVAAFTAGKINAFITLSPPGPYAYPDGLISGA